MFEALCDVFYAIHYILFSSSSSCYSFYLFIFIVIIYIYIYTHAAFGFLGKEGSGLRV